MRPKKVTKKKSETPRCGRCGGECTVEELWKFSGNCGYCAMSYEYSESQGKHRYYGNQSDLEVTKVLKLN